MKHSMHEQRLREACRDRCGEFGDPPCFELDCWDPEAKDAYCVDCRRDCGEDVENDPSPLDPDAVMKPLL